MLRHFTKDKKHLKIYKSDFFLHSVLEDMFMHQFMQNKNLSVIFDILKLIFYQGKLSKNEGEKENFTQSLYKKSCKRSILFCFQIFFVLHERVDVDLKKNASSLNFHPSV